jgi:hypothetical protein
MTFKPDTLLLTGEIQTTLSNAHIVPARLTIKEDGEVTLVFTDPDQARRWAMETMNGSLIGLHIETLTNRPVPGDLE